MLLDLSYGIMSLKTNMCVAIDLEKHTANVIFYSKQPDIADRVQDGSPKQKQLDSFIRYCVVRVDGNALSVKRYNSEESYWKDIACMASTFTEKKEAVREAKRVAKMSRRAFLPYEGA